MSRDDATERQVLAARPDQSTWLSANAGSGKTRVLTDRVARLLLDGVEPQHILCLTYTKAAASEMQNRLFKRLGIWAMMPDDKLREQLLELGTTGTINEAELRNARTLFARAIEAPGGLKIQTIHSFCASLLRRFPLEAGVSPQFTEIEERAAALLRAEVVQTMSLGDHAPLVMGLAQHLTDADFVAITAEIVSHKHAFQTPLGKAEIYAHFDVDPNFKRGDLATLPFDGSEKDLLLNALPILEGQSATAIKTGAALATVNLDAPTFGDLNTLYATFLHRDGGTFKPTCKTSTIPGKKALEALGVYGPIFHEFMDRVATTREAELALMAAEKTLALHEFAASFLPLYEAQKQRRGWLDFDDLILKARDLLTDPNVALWVLYRLDGGIDHILVDEAQDTSPVQWGVIERLAQEFTSGAGSRPDVARTIFVVGDKKQSIYSFQGADPREFDRMQAEFATRLANTENPLQSLILQYSFRSSPEILALVDKALLGQDAAGFTPDQFHRAFKTSMPGRVDLWPVVEPVKSGDEGEWHSPVDQLGSRHHAVILAQGIAQEIKAIVDSKTLLPDDSATPGTFNGRPVQYGDFLILVQRRSDLFQEIIRECKKLNLPIAGADRLKVGAELAVKDLAALLSFLALPEDDLSLATALRSPLFGWSEQTIYDLAHKRSHLYLWPALRERADEFPAPLAILNDLRKQADFLRPYDLIERILTRHQGRKTLLARLGPEAEDGIDALLTQALNYERTAVPSLTGFLTWMETDNLEIKRQMGEAGNRIRVMTVHGAKGLESPIVILPDTGKRDVQIKDALLQSNGPVLWNTTSVLAPNAITAAKAEKQTALEAERDRLLYVAMTRAEKWLIVAAAGDLDKNGNSWYQKIQGAMETSNAVDQTFPTGTGLRIESANWAELEPVMTTITPSTIPDMPAYFQTPTPEFIAPLPTLSPSELGGAKALAGDTGLDENTAKKRGRQIHKLLEILPTEPQDNWRTAAGLILGGGPDRATESEIDNLFVEARSTLQTPALAPIFAANALAEVSISANLDALSSRRINGIIDRLIITETRILAVDFKTNAIVPDTPETCPVAILRQMGAYAAALAQTYPNHEIETAILWTRTATLMTLPHDVVVEALNTTQIS